MVPFVLEIILFVVLILLLFLIDILDSIFENLKILLDFEL